MRRQHGPPKRRYPTTVLHGVTTQKTSTRIRTLIHLANFSIGTSLPNTNVHQNPLCLSNFGYGICRVTDARTYITSPSRFHFKYYVSGCPCVRNVIRKRNPSRGQYISASVYIKKCSLDAMVCSWGDTRSHVLHGIGTNLSLVVLVPEQHTRRYFM
jgi:hypothetical protein